MTTTSVDVRASTSIRDWLAVVAVGLGVFAFTTTEMVPIGLLTTMSGDLGVSEGSTGLTVTLYGAIAGLFAPVLTSATRRLDRRTLLLVVLAVFVVGNAMTALSATYGLLMFSRLLTGFAHGVMWSISASIAVRLVAPEASVRATAVVFSGISVASVIGVPLGTFIGEVADWRTAFWVIAALGAVTAVAAAVLLPPLAPQGVVNLRELPRLLRVRNLRVALLVTAVVVIGHFAAYTYVTPFLERNTGVETRWISGLLLLYGVAGIVGNFAAGAAAARALRGTIIACLVGLGGSVALLVVVGTWHPGAIALLLLWGVAYTALPVALQTLVFRSAPEAPEAATSLYILAFNVSISLGALFGGIAIDNAGPTAVMVLGVVLSLVAAAVMALRHQRGEVPR
ncbi:putative MFS family arabinose efflux permease [Saccharothrix saharensis]|uniref:Putative MFS family arabinose efflux permease n=1 Tax=Saccharothrix saharensis TaxID=571190 RepID=A0A543JRH7_9PSEU|nr:MFS transporter [Saccharothrix saharensis]TQM85364.1 putative MFS family arabinose efflux permease [Saccharothrix saharensis]